MKTSKEQRILIRFGLGVNGVNINPFIPFQYERLTDALDDLDTLETKVKWQAEMLERAAGLFNGDIGIEEWLADLERGEK